MTLDGSEEARISALEARLESHVESQRELRSADQRAVDIAAASIRNSFDKNNEFRQALSDQAATFLPRQEYESKHEALTTRIGFIEQLMSKMQGRTIGVSAAISVAIPVLIVLVAALIARL